MTEIGRTVLVADDDPDFRALYRAWVPEAYGLRMAVDGRDALDSLTDDVDAVILDRKMPRMRGEAVAKAIDDREAFLAAIDEAMTFTQDRPELSVRTRAPVATESP